MEIGPPVQKLSAANYIRICQTKSLCKAQRNAQKLICYTRGHFQFQMNPDPPPQEDRVSHRATLLKRLSKRSLPITETGLNLNELKKTSFKDNRQFVCLKAIFSFTSTK